MKKFVKMSLVAAVAVAGLTTTSSAANLADSIKDTTMNGYVRYRINTSSTNNADNTQATEGKVVGNLKTKVNDAVTANVKFVAVYDDADNGAATVTTANINQANFIIKTAPATLIAGLQTSQSPFVANNGDTRSNGLTALIPAGPVTIAAAHYLDTIASVGTVEADVTAAGVIGSVAGVNAEAWYARSTSSDVVATATENKRWAILASAKVGPVSISAHHAELDTGAATADDRSNSQILVSGKVSNVSLYGAYATTGKDGGDTSLDTDTDGRLILALETINTKSGDTDAFAIGASMPVGPVKVSLDYCDADVGTAVTADETKLTVAYAMSKNFKLSAWYSDYDQTGTASDKEKTRVEAKYSF